MRASDLAALLGMSEAALERWAKKHEAAPTKRYRVEVYWWHELAQHLTARQRVEARRLARKDVELHSSRQWLSGYPELVRQWHPKKNVGIEPWEISYGSTRTIWWKCDKGPDHEWPRSANARSRGSGCPCCSGYRLSVTNRLGTRNPALAKQWHPTKNGDLSPSDVTFGSSKKVWWKCDEGPDHEWQANVAARHGRGAGCPACAGLQASVTNSLASVRPGLAKQWHPTKNGKLRPTEVVAASGKKAWWRCPEGRDHVWSSVIYDRALGGIGCPYCSGRRVSLDNNLRRLRPDLTKQWHPTKNRNLTPRDVTLGTNRGAWWKCPKGDDHEWKAAIAARVQGQGCPFCSGKRASVGYSLAKTFPAVAKEWHPTKNGRLRPGAVPPVSDTKAWWRCSKNPAHEWQTSVASRTHNKAGCPYCSGNRVSDDNRLSTLFPNVANEWHPTKNGKLKPDAVHRGSDRQVWWKCATDRRHVWQAPVKVRTKHLSRCPICTNRKVHPTNSLARKFPKIAAEWHPTKNGKLTPKDIVAVHQMTRVWWQCRKVPSHAWQMRPRDRVLSGTGCPLCAARARKRKT